jgi:hypothetical protein
MLIYLNAAVRCKNLWSYCSVSILPYVVGAQEFAFEVSDYSAIWSLVYYRQCMVCYCMIFKHDLILILGLGVCVQCVQQRLGRSFTAMSSEDGHSESKIKLALYLIKPHAMKIYGRVEIQCHQFWCKHWMKTSVFTFLKAYLWTVGVKAVLIL